jgi:hypothetical protein
VLERKILPAPGGFECAANASGIHTRLIRWTFPISAWTRVLSLPLLMSFHTLNGRRVLPQIMLPPKYLLEWFRAS